MPGSSLVFHNCPAKINLVTILFFQTPQLNQKTLVCASRPPSDASTSSFYDEFSSPLEVGTTFVELIKRQVQSLKSYYPIQRMTLRLNAVFFHHNNKKVGKSTATASEIKGFPNRQVRKKSVVVSIPGGPSHWLYLVSLFDVVDVVEMNQSYLLRCRTHLVLSVQSRLERKTTEMS